MAKVAFIGLGNMGSGMAANLAKAGHEVRAFDLSEAALEKAEKAGCTRAASAAEAATDADTVVTMLPAGKHVRDVYENSIFGAAPKTAILIDCSTIDVASARDVIAHAEKAGYQMVDAPVSGGTAGAEAGSLAIMAGGRVEDVERVRPILMQLGQRLTRMGEVGAGQVTKACNQMIVACNALVIAEVVALAERSGVDASLIAPALAGGFADSKPLQILAPQMANSEFEPIKWHVRTLLKDLDTAVQLSREEGSATPMTGLAAQLMRLHGSQGHLEQDPATLVRMYREQGQ